MGGDQVQDTTKSQTRRQDAQDAKDATLTLLASGCMVDTCDATEIFADIASRKHNNMALLEYWTGKPPRVGHLRIFGLTAWVHILSPRDKT